MRHPAAALFAAFLLSACTTPRLPDDPWFLVVFPDDASGVPEPLPVEPGEEVGLAVGIGWFTRDRAVIAGSSFAVPLGVASTTVVGRVESGEALIESMQLLDANGSPVSDPIPAPPGSRATTCTSWKLVPSAGGSPWPGASQAASGSGLGSAGCDPSLGLGGDPARNPRLQRSLGPEDLQRVGPDPTS